MDDPNSSRGNGRAQDRGIILNSIKNDDVKENHDRVYQLIKDATDRISQGEYPSVAIEYATEEIMKLF